MEISFRRRLGLLSLIFAVIAGVVITKLFFIQIVRGEYYQDLSTRQTAPTQDLFDRGTIFFSRQDGSTIAAATVKSGYTLAVKPNVLPPDLDREAFYKRLNSVIPLGKEALFAKLDLTNDPYEVLATRLDEATAKKVRALDLDGLEVSDERWRFYPAGTLAAHAVGFFGWQGNELRGRYGLEREYDNVLGRTQQLSFGNFFAAVFGSLGDKAGLNKILGKNEAEGGDLVTTIEPEVARTLEHELQEIMNRFEAKSVGGLVMDPVTGEVLALAALPNFDPGKKPESLEVLTNPLVERVFEMGSVIKPLTVAAALDTGAITPDTTYLDTGSVTLNGIKIRNYDGQSHGQVNMQEVLNKSLNTGAVFAMQKLGREKFRQYFENYGFGEKTGIDLPGELPGLTQSLRSAEEVDYASASFGQGVAITPIATARALATLASGGKLITPRLVKKISYRHRPDEVLEPPASKQVLKPETAQTITSMLVKVVDDALLGGTVKLPHYQVAAKTGTAQIASAAGGGYYEDRFLHSFFGYFPASKPRFLVFLYAEEPQKEKYAAYTLTTPFFNLAKFLLNYYKVAPDR